MRTHLGFWRAALRLARRDAWRNQGRSALVALMIALPVVALSAVSVVYRSYEQDSQDRVRLELGDEVQATLDYGNGEPVTQKPDPYYGKTYESSDEELARSQFVERAQKLISSRDSLITDNQVYGLTGVRWEGKPLDNVSLREINYTADGFGNLIEQASGRAPEADGEVVVSRELADTGVEIGDRLTYQASKDGAGIEVTVVGVFDSLEETGQAQVIGSPGTLFPDGALDTVYDNGVYGGGTVSLSLLVTGPDPVTWDQVLDLNRLGSIVLSRDVIADPPPDDQVRYSAGETPEDLGAAARVMAIIVVVIGLALLQVALLAGPAIAVGARRNQRSLALIAASGAEERHLRAVVLATNGLIGLVSSVLAAGLGALVGLAAIVVMRWYDVLFVSIQVNVGDLAVLAVVGAGTAVAAALVPARQVARQNVVVTLTGRRDFSPPRRRVPVSALLIAVAGVALAVYASGSNHAFLTVAGLALAEIGLVMVAGPVVSLVARSAGRLPFSPRFALRDASRQRSRTAPAVAAVMAAIAGSTTALVYLAVLDTHEQLAYRANAAEGVAVAVMDTVDNPLTADDLTGVENLLRSELPVRSLQPYTVLAERSSDEGIRLTPQRSPEVDCPGEPDNDTYSCSDASDLDSLTFIGDDLFDDGTALTALSRGAADQDAAALKAGYAVASDPELIWPDGYLRVSVEHWEEDSDKEDVVDVVKVKAVAAQGDGSVIGVVYPLAAAQTLGVDTATGGYVVDTTRMPTDDEEASANDLLDARYDVEIEVERGYSSDYAIPLVAMLVAALMVSLVGTFTAVGLAAAETRSDVSTLAAIGAAPGTRRRVVAAQSGVISALGAGLGLVSGILSGWILFRLEVVRTSEFATTPWEFVLPWSHLLGVGLGIPLAAVLIAFVATRSKLPVARRVGQ